MKSLCNYLVIWLVLLSFNKCYASHHLTSESLHQEHESKNQAEQGRKSNATAPNFNDYGDIEEYLNDHEAHLTNLNQIQSRNTTTLGDKSKSRAKKVKREVAKSKQLNSKMKKYKKKDTHHPEENKMKKGLRKRRKIPKSNLQKKNKTKSEEVEKKMDKLRKQIKRLRKQKNEIEIFSQLDAVYPGVQLNYEFMKIVNSSMSNYTNIIGTNGEAVERSNQTSSNLSLETSAEELKQNLGISMLQTNLKTLEDEIGSEEEENLLNAIDLDLKSVPRSEEDLDSDYNTDVEETDDDASEYNDDDSGTTEEEDSIEDEEEEVTTNNRIKDDF